MNTLSRVRACLVPAAILACLVGCQPPEPFQAGQTGLWASGANGRVWIDIENPKGDTMTLVAAAEDALRSRGYVQKERTHLDDDPIVVRGKRAGAGLGEGSIAIRMGGRATRLEVRVDPYGNEAEAREILGHMLQRLGY